jgi:uncharacterized protein (TIGR02246 family)
MPLPADDVIAIQNVIAEYAHAVDHGDGDAFAALFTEDGLLDVGLPEPSEGREAIKLIGDQTALRLPGIRHLTFNVVVSGDGDTAYASSYSQVVVTAGGAKATKLLLSGIYRDTLRKEGGRWRFVTRVMTIDS